VLPQCPGFSRTPGLLKTGGEETVQVVTSATADDVAAGLADKVGATIHKIRNLPAPPLFFDSISRADPNNPQSPQEGNGRFNVECYLLSVLGLPEANFNAAQIYTCRWLFDGVFPAIMLVALSYLPIGRLGRDEAQWLAARARQKDRDDRFFVKMKMPINSDWESDKRELENLYTRPQSLDYLKLFPNSNWEFTKWTSGDVIGFGTCWLVALAILGLLWGVVNLHV
jgi:solute:Na+ symporter, SSS family